MPTVLRQQSDVNPLTAPLPDEAFGTPLLSP
jgi:hypothetical protein